MNARAAQWHDGSSRKPLGKSSGNVLRWSKPKEFLNRTIKFDVLNDEMTLEADTKLVEGALESMKLNDAKGADSPRVRRTEEQTTQVENSEKLTSAESTLNRSLVMKLSYVAQNRVDIDEAAKCLARHMKEPRSG